MQPGYGATVKAPSAALIDWLGRAVGAEVAVVRGLRQGGNPWLVSLDMGSTVARAVVKEQVADSPGGVVTEVAALAVSSANGIPAPRLIVCDRDGAAAGVPVVVESELPGGSQIPRVVSSDRLRSAGAAIAALHRVVLVPSAELPLRRRPIPVSDFIAERRSGTTSSTPLLDAAAAAIISLSEPGGAEVFVHGDMWHGNVLWDGERVSGFVDWDMAGVGHPGIDVSSLRLDAALLFGSGAADEVLDGWLDARGARIFEALEYWDVVAAANTPTDLAVFVSAFHSQGREDLDAALLNERRDEFLGSALRRLRSGGSG